MQCLSGKQGGVLVALAHQVTDPAKGDDGEEAGFGLWANPPAVAILPVSQHLNVTNTLTSPVGT